MSNSTSASATASSSTTTTTKFDFKGKRFLVTGAGRGIGRQIVEHLIESNAKVIGISKTPAKLEALKKDLPKVEILKVDVADAKALKAAVESIQGPIDGLVNVAGMAQMFDVLKDDLDPEAIHKQFSINVYAPMILSQIVGRHLVKRGAKGNIVNISSLGSLRAFKDHLVYGATKAALDYATKTFALELGPHGIRVNSINPTVVNTELALDAGWGDPQKAAALKAKIPLRKFNETRDVSNLALYLLSDQSDMVTGALVPIDGGYSA